MAPKKPAAKGAKKEEVIDIPKTSALPDGKRTFFLGGWSTYSTFAALGDISKLGADAGDNVVVLPGNIPAAAAAPDPHAAHKASAAGARPPSQPVEVVAVAPAPAAAAVAAHPAAPGAAAAAPNAAAAAPPGPTIIEPEYPKGYVPVRAMTIGGPSAWVAPAAATSEAKGDETEEVDAAAKAAAEQAAKEAAKPDRSVVFEGDVNITGWRAPIIIQPVAPTPVAPTPAPKRGTKVTVKIEEEAPPPPPPKPKEEEKGAAPSQWPTVTFVGVSFSGTVSVKGAHVVFKRCHFSNPKGAQLHVHQYCKVTVEGCSFAFSEGTGVYAFPCSQLTVSKSSFGVDAPTFVESHLTSTALYVDDAQVVVTGSSFEKTGYGIVFNDKCQGSTVTRSTFDAILTTAVVCGAHNVAELKSNTVKRCGYYGFHFLAGSTTRALVNTVSPPVRVDKGASPFLHSNTLAVNLVSENRGEAPYMNSTY